MNFEDAEKAISKMERKHNLSKWFTLLFGVWLFSLPLLPDTFPYIGWLRARDPATLYPILGVFSFVWTIDNWRTTKELKLLKVTLEMARKNA